MTGHDGAESADERLRLLREETARLVAQLPGPISSVEVTSGDYAIAVRWADPAPVAVAPAAAAAVAAPAATVVAPAVTAEPAGATLVPVRAPLVGAFYRRPAPGQDPFVVEGDVVEPGQTLCIVEAMKLMNEIKADRKGTVAAIHAEDGAMVEFDQLLVELIPVEE